MWTGCAGAGTIFALTWPLYSNGITEAVVASSVVWASTAKFVLVGLKVLHDPQFASSMGAAPGQEHLLLQGPVHYGTVIATLTMFRFKTSFSVVPIGVLCGGDAFAAIIGRWYGKRRLPWNHNKVRTPKHDYLCALIILSSEVLTFLQTVVGSLAFVAGALSVTSGLICFLNVFDKHSSHWINGKVFTQALVASLLGAVVETAPALPPLGNADNLLVPASSLLVMMSTSV